MIAQFGCTFAAEIKTEILWHKYITFTIWTTRLFSASTKARPFRKFLIAMRSTYIDSLFADYLYYLGRLSVVQTEKNCLDAQFLASNRNSDSDTCMCIYEEYKQWKDSLMNKSTDDFKWDWSYQIRRNEGQLMRDNYWTGYREFVEKQDLFPYYGNYFCK